MTSSTDAEGQADSGRRGVTRTAVTISGRPETSTGNTREDPWTPLTDTFGRTATDLRISVTDRCNFRCTYCMPTEGVAWTPHENILRFEEIQQLARVFARLGIRKIRVTGGEPLVRRDLHELIRMLAETGVPELALTTNGSLLKRKAALLADAGLTRINISLDSLRPDRFAKMARFDGFDRVIAGIEAAEAAGLSPIKVNCVAIRGFNDDEFVDFARFSRETGHDVRFIEFMPLDAEKAWNSRSVVSADEIVAAIDARFPLEAGVETGPAVLHRFADGEPGSVSVIASVSRPFCSNCNRIRITADGRLLSCLFALEDTDLKTLLRNGADDDEIATAIGTAVRAKWEGHAIGQAGFVRPARSMSMIGG